jgi:hypothetical protein
MQTTCTCEGRLLVQCPYCGGTGDAALGGGASCSGPKCDCGDVPCPDCGGSGVAKGGGQHSGRSSEALDVATPPVCRECGTTMFAVPCWDCPRCNAKTAGGAHAGDVAGETPAVPGQNTGAGPGAIPVTSPDKVRCRPEASPPSQKTGGEGSDSPVASPGLIQFVGWLSAEIPELHSVEAPRLIEAAEKWTVLLREDVTDE